MYGLLLFLFAAASTTFAPLRLYNGTWTITAPITMAGDGKPDTLADRCTEGEAFYSCEQIVNGKSMALIIFTSAGEPGKFYTQAVLPTGKALGRSDLTITGDHWTYRSTGTDDTGKPVSYRIENTFTGRDKIHFEQYESADGQSWVMKNHGDEVRTAQ